MCFIACKVSGIDLSAEQAYVHPEDVPEN